ncbi:GTP cyclohydrolase II RibA [Phytohalomonas tamaricis]|uniref:GTP cyclohydrolase II RibA n=1 Tax=Phytohalomonas tamaricis TaxID=2081032 RepID=UPI000D0BE02D|nr:GTP cyclohydrolase II RibA [Phytohalomonas tamaricis]
MRQVERAIFDIRRGLPVLLRDEKQDTLVHPIEAINDAALTHLASDVGESPALVLTRHRLASLGHHINADAACLPLERINEIDAATLSALTQTRAPIDEHTPLFERLPQAAAPADHAALALMRRALLIPAALTMRVSEQQRQRLESLVEEGEILAISAAKAARCVDSASGLLKRVSEASVPLDDAEKSRFILFREPDGLREHVAVVIGEPDQWLDAVPVRLHSACLTGDLFGSLRCDCGEQLRNGVAGINAMGGGVLLYLAQEGRGIGLANKLRAYTLQDEGLDTVDADQILGFGDDERGYGVAIDMLVELGIKRIQLLTNNPRKIDAMQQGGIEVVDRRALFGRLTEQNYRYLNAKATRSGHMLDNVLNGDS